MQPQEKPWKNISASQMARALEADLLDDGSTITVTAPTGTVWTKCHRRTHRVHYVAHDGSHIMPRLSAYSAIMSVLATGYYTCPQAEGGYNA